MRMDAPRNSHDKVWADVPRKVFPKLLMSR
jgi:hypothetical protein